MKLVLVMAVWAVDIVVRKPMVGEETVNYLEHHSGIKLLMIKKEIRDCEAAFRLNVGFLKIPPKFKPLTYVISHLLRTARSQNYPEKSISNSSHMFTGAREDMVSLVLRSSCKNFGQDFKVVSLMLDSPVFDQVELEKILGKMKLNEYSLKKEEFYTFGDVESIEFKISDLEIPNLMEKINNFYKKHFKLNRLVVTMGGPSIFMLEKAFSEAFEGVKPDRTPPPKYKSGQSLTHPKLGKTRYFNFPSGKSKVGISIVFTNGEHKLPTNPLNFIKYLINSDHRGSLGSLLEGREWTAYKHVFPEKIVENYSEVRTDIDLTEEGVNHKEEVISLFFEYFKFIAKNWKPYVYGDYCKYKESKFMFYPMPEVFDPIIEICDNIFNFSPDRALSAKFDAAPDPDGKILEILRQVTPQNAFITVHSHDTKAKTEITTLKIIANLPSFELPPKQAYKIDLDKLQRKTLSIRKSSQTVKSRLVDITPTDLAGILSLYHLPGMSSGLPVCGITVNILLEKGHRTKLFGHFADFVINKIISEKAYEINKIFYNLSVNVSGSTTKTGIKFFVKGFSSDIRGNTKILIDFMKELSNPKIDGERFDKEKDMYIQSSESFSYESLDYRKDLILALMTNAPNSFSSDALSAVRAISRDEITNYIKSLLIRFYPQVIVSGDVTKEEAREVLEDIKKSFSSSFRQVKSPRYSFYNLDESYTLLANSSYRNYQIYYAYYLGTDIKALAFEKIFGKYANRVLQNMKGTLTRNDETHIFSLDFHEHRVLVFSVDSSSFDNGSILEKIPIIINTVLDKIKSLNEEEFRDLKEEVRLYYPLSFGEIQEHHNYLLGRIQNRSLPSNSRVVKAVDKMTLEEFKAITVDKFVTNLRRSRLVVTETQHTDYLKEPLQKTLLKNEKLYFGHRELQEVLKTYPSTPKKKIKRKSQA